jgi:hypothetical protein
MYYVIFEFKEGTNSSKLNMNNYHECSNKIEVNILISNINSKNHKNHKNHEFCQLENIIVFDGREIQIDPKVFLKDVKKSIKNFGGVV